MHHGEGTWKFRDAVSQRGIRLCFHLDYVKSNDTTPVLKGWCLGQCPQSSVCPSDTLVQITMTFVLDIHGSQMMTPNDFGNIILVII